MRGRTKAMGAVVAGFAAIVGLAGCGGGSSEDDDPTHVSLTEVTPSAFAVQTYEDQPASSPALHIGISGNVKALNGQTVYAITETPLAFFHGTHELTSNSSPPSVDVILHSDPADRPAPGVYEHQVKLYACLDTACSRMLRNSPLTVHYTVTVLAR